MSDTEAPLRSALDLVAQGANLDEALRAVADGVVARFGAAACRVWLVKAGDVCGTCGLAGACENREMCLHLKASTAGDSDGVARVPLVVFRDRSCARGGGAPVRESSAGSLLFPDHAERHPGAHAFAAVPLRGPAGVLGLVGVLAREGFSPGDLDALRAYADAATLAVRVADLSSRTRRASLRLEAVSGERDEIAGLLYAILNGSDDYSVIAEDLDGRVTVFSEGARTTYGYAPEEVIGRASADVLFAPEEIEGSRVANILGAAVESGSVEAIVTRMRKTGERFPARARFTVRRDREGDPCGFVVVERDLSRERSGMGLSGDAASPPATAAESIRGTMSSHATGDASGGGENLRRALAELGIERDALEERAHMLDEERVLLVAERERLLAQRDNRISELEALVQERATARDEEHAAELAGLRADLHAARDAAARAESRAATLEASGRALEARVRDVEAERDRLFAEREALVSRRAQLEAWVANLSTQTASATALASSREAELAERDGRLDAAERSARARAEAAAAESARLGELVASLTARAARLEAELAEARSARAGGVRAGAPEELARLARAHDSKSRLLADMSHELRSPMNAIIGYTSLVLEDAASLPERHRETLRKVERNARDLLQLINNVLDLSKIEAGKMEVFPEPVDLAELASHARSVVEPQTAGRQLELLVDVPPDCSRVVTDRTKLQQILVNLLTNAVKFTPFGKVSVRAAAEGDRVSVSVVDTGVGIGPEHLDAIFEEYGQVTAAGGTGLGLPISRRLARLLGGDLTVSSRPGWGSTFTLTIPRALCGAAESASEVDAVREGAALVYAADPNEAFLVGKYLREARRDAVVVETQPHASELLAAAKPCVAVVDVTGDGGWELLDALAAAGVPTVGVGPAAERGRAFARSARAYVARPIERQDLVRAVSRVLSGSRPRLLVIDDEDDARDLMSRMVGGGDFDVDVAPGGPSALERMRERRPDLIVLDLMMPEMDGFELVHQLNANPDWRDIPVLLVTAKDLSAAERRALGAGVRRVMRKGELSREEILAEIDRAVNVQ